MKRKNKVAEEEKNRQKHRSNRTNNLERALPNRTEKPKFLIVCEGVNTEVDYFDHFKCSFLDIKTVGTGRNTLSLVEFTEAFVQKEQQRGKEYDQIWCVFDKDDFSTDAFNEAVFRAQRSFGEGHAAYSNQAFEYWFLLHFEDHQGGAIHRNQYNNRLNRYLSTASIVYDGTNSKRVSIDFFDFMQPLQDIAITRAKRIYENLEHHSPALEESSTTVFRLVEEINKYRI